MVEDIENENSNVSNSDEPVLLNTPLSDKVECSDPEVDIDEIDAFLAMEVSSNFEEGYYDSEGDVIFLESLFSDDTTHNLSPKVIFDHEPKQNESIHNTSITFSPRSDPLHHEFAGEIITLPSRIAREHEEYLSLMTLLCEISTSQSPESFHANPSSIITSPIPVQEEIDIFLGDLISPGVKKYDFEDEDNSTFLLEHKSPNLDHQDNPSAPRPPPERPEVKIHLEPDTAMINNFDVLNKEACFNLEECVQIFLPFFTYPEDSPFILSFGSEDLIFYPGIFIFHFSYLELVVFSMEVSYSNLVTLPQGCDDRDVKVATWDDLAFKFIILGWNVKHSTDIAKISRKRSKPDNHGHGNGKENTRAGRMLSKSYTSSKAPIGQFPKENDTRTMKETHQDLVFCTKSCLKEAQRPLTHGCHVGNPCAPQSNPTVQVKHQMIEGMKGQDPRECMPDSGA
ncbi:hypothetical protein Tco_1147706 [Tanacetum coccineum]